MVEEIAPDLEYFEKMVHCCVFALTGIKRVCLLVFLMFLFPRSNPVRVWLVPCYWYSLLMGTYPLSNITNIPKDCLHCHLLTYFLTYSMEHSPCWEYNRFSASQEIPAFYGTRRFITACTSACQLSLYWVSSIQSIPPHPTSWRSILILSSHLRLGFAGGVFPSGFITKTPYTPLLFPIPATCPAHPMFPLSLNTICRK